MESVNQLSNETSNTAFDMFEDGDDKDNDILVRSTLEAEKSLSQQEEKWEGSGLRGPVTGASSGCSGGKRDIVSGASTPAELLPASVRRQQGQSRKRPGSEM